MEGKVRHRITVQFAAVPFSIGDRAAISEQIQDIISQDVLGFLGYYNYTAWRLMKARDESVNVSFSEYSLHHEETEKAHRLMHIGMEGEISLEDEGHIDWDVLAEEIEAAFTKQGFKNAKCKVREDVEDLVI